jgi:biotin operon repressor
LVAKFKEAVVAISEKGGNITKAQLARELGCTRKDVSENREALQLAIEELQAESP